MTPYRNTLEDLYQLQRHGIKLGLEPTMAILKRLGNPHVGYVNLHIGGTNGKGSAAAMVASVLQASGYRVGLYTSPHLIDFRERIRVQGMPLPESQVIELADRIRLAAGTTISLTFFEFTTAMAFQYFADEQVDVAVVEVGMGGRFDATNVLEPLGVLITNIGFDHEQFLGHSLPEIAFEKAGIIKKGTSVVLGPMADDAKQVIERYAVDQAAVPYAFPSDFRVSHQAGFEFNYQGLHWSLSRLHCALAGDHQILNAACALALLEIGAFKGLKVSESAIRGELAQIRWEGRLETVQRDPHILLDGAHNVAAAQVLASFLAGRLDHTPHAKLILVVGMMQDKNHTAFLEILTPLAEHLILTQASISRSASVQDLSNALPRNCCPVYAEGNPSEALKIAKQLAGPDDLICITGSLILVGELKACLLRSDDSSCRE